MTIQKLLSIGFLSLLAACAAEQEKAVEVPAPKANGTHLARLSDADCKALLQDDGSVPLLQQALARSLDYLEKLPADRVLNALDRRVQVGELRTLLTEIQPLIGSADWSSGVCDRAAVYRAEIADDLLITGYYQPEIRASRKRTGTFRYPLYREPDDLVEVDTSQFCSDCGSRVLQGRIKDGRLIPYYSRAEIDRGALNGKGYEIAWVEDPVDAFFMHVQGSAVLRFDDGVQMNVSYSSSNGRPYTSIGRVLIERGKMSRDSMSLQALRSYLRTHPNEQDEIMATNERYIFFRAVTSGPVGSLGMPLSAGRSIAADGNVLPRGGLVFLKIDPRADTPDKSRTARFFLVQDSGVAITGPSRIDVYWGTGETAESIAGDMRNPGQLLIVLPR